MQRIIFGIIASYKKNFWEADEYDLLSPFHIYIYAYNIYSLLEIY